MSIAKQEEGVKQISWKEFILPECQGGCSLQCAITNKPGGKISAIIRPSISRETTVIIRAEDEKSPVEVMAHYDLPEGMQMVKISHDKHNSKHFKIPLKSSRKGKSKSIELHVDRPAEDKLTVSVNGLYKSDTHILRFYTDKGGVVTLNSEYTPSLMRGGNKIRIGRSHGYGVFAIEEISEGEIVEEAPTLSQTSSFLTDYTFGMQDKHVLPIGHMVMYNHSDEPTCAHNMDARGEIMTLTATRKIKAGEELTINYGPMYFLARGYRPNKIA